MRSSERNKVQKIAFRQIAGRDIGKPRLEVVRPGKEAKFAKCEAKKAAKSGAKDLVCR